MNQLRAAGLQPKAVSAGMLWLVGTAIVLTQLTSLALGPGANRQLNVSLAVPAVDLEDVSSSVGSQLDAVLGTIVTVEPVGARQTRVAAPLKSTGRRSVAIPAATLLVSSSPVASASEPSVIAGHSRHGERRHGRGLAKVRPPVTD